MELAIVGNDEWGFWKVAIDGCTVVQHNRDEVAQMYAVGSTGGWWLDGYQATKILNIPSACAAIVEDLVDATEAEEAAGKVGEAVSAVAATAVASSVGAAVSASVWGSVPSSAAGTAGRAAGGAAVGYGGFASRVSGASGAMMLVFTLQKLSTTTASTNIKTKTPVVSALGEQFQWANLMVGIGGDRGSKTSATNGTGNVGSFRRILSAPAVMVGRGADSIGRGANGIGMLTRIGTRRFNRWNERRNETIAKVLGAAISESVRRLVDAAATTVSSDNSTQLDVCALVAATKEEAKMRGRKGANQFHVADTSAEDALEEKYEGNLFLITILFALFCMVHKAMQCGIQKPYQQLLREQVHTQTRYHPDLAMPHLFGRTQQPEGSKEENDNGEEVHPAVHNTDHPVVLLAHQAVFEARPVYYRFTTSIVGAMRNNPFPNPELLFVGLAYQGSCLSSSSIMLNSNDWEAGFAAIVFIVLPLGYLFFICWHCIYQVWWCQRALYSPPKQKNESNTLSESTRCAWNPFHRAVDSTMQHSTQPPEPSSKPVSMGLDNRQNWSKFSSPVLMNDQQFTLEPSRPPFGMHELGGALTAAGQTPAERKGQTPLARKTHSQYPQEMETPLSMYQVGTASTPFTLLFSPSSPPPSLLSPGGHSARLNPGGRFLPAGVQEGG
jgi:hypothetical protein